MSSSLTHRLDQISTIGSCWTVLEAWELSASSAESHMRMVDFITMYSAISDGSLAQEKLTYSMWEAATQTSSQLEGLRRKLTTTHARMAMWSLEGSRDLAQTQIGTLMISGLQRHIRDLLASFCTFATNWLHEISYEASLSLRRTLDGSGMTQPLPTNSPAELCITRKQLMDCVHGCFRLNSDLDRLDRYVFSYCDPPKAGERRGILPGGPLPLPLAHSQARSAHR